MGYITALTSVLVVCVAICAISWRTMLCARIVNTRALLKCARSSCHSLWLVAKTILTIARGTASTSRTSSRAVVTCVTSVVVICVAALAAGGIVRRTACASITRAVLITILIVASALFQSAH